MSIRKYIPYFPKRIQSQNDWLRQYLKNRQQLLFEMIRLEAPPPDRMCINCASSPGHYRCKDCLPKNFFCSECCIAAHVAQPFHRIQKFTDGSFEGYDLDQLGFILDIRPHSGSCSRKDAPVETADSYTGSDTELDWEDDDDNTPFYQSQSSKFFQLVSDSGKIVIVSSTGIFTRNIQWCTCPNAPEKHIQLLRTRLFPATFVNPKSAFTFDVLDYFRLDALECNTSAMNFMAKLMRRTSGMFPESLPVWNACIKLRRCSRGRLPISQDRYRELLRISRQWRDLRNRMRAGQAHDRTSRFVPGGLALFCPACPQSGINIPPNNEWKSGEE